MKLSLGQKVGLWDKLEGGLWFDLVTDLRPYLRESLWVNLQSSLLASLRGRLGSILSIRIVIKERYDPDLRRKV